MKIFWKTQTLEMAESDIFCANSDANHDVAIENWLRLFFVEILSLPCPKNGRHNAPEKPVGKILEMAESGIFCGKSDADHDAAVENCLRYFSAEILALRCPKSGLQNSPKKPVGNALFGKPLRANGYCDAIEIHLK